MSIIVPWTSPGEDPCCCPECNAPTLLCDTISASRSKPGPPGCAFGEFVPSTPPRYYLKKTTQKDWTWGLETHTNSATCPPFPPDRVYILDVSATGVGTSTHIEVCDGETELYSKTCSGLATYHCEAFENLCQLSGQSGEQDLTVTDYDSDTLYCDAPVYTYGGSDPFVVASPHCSIVDPSFGITPPITFEDDITRTRYVTSSTTTGDTVDTREVTITEELSDPWSPEATSSLIARTIGALPDYPGTYEGSCLASRNLSPDESSYTLQRTQYKFRFTPPTFGLGYQIEWIERFTPEGGGAPTDTARTFIWVGVDPGEEQYSAVFTLNEPATDGVIAIVEIVFTCPEIE